MAHATTWEIPLDTDFKETVNLKQKNGTAFDLTGHNVTAEVRPHLDSKTLLGTATVTVTSTVGGVVDIELTDTQINAIKKGRHILDVKIVRTSDSYIVRSQSVILSVIGRVTA